MRFRQVELELYDPGWNGHKVMRRLETAGVRIESTPKVAKAIDAARTRLHGRIRWKRDRPLPTSCEPRSAPNFDRLLGPRLATAARPAGSYPRGRPSGTSSDEETPLD